MRASLRATKVLKWRSTISDDTAGLVPLISEWLKATRDVSPATGLDVDDALKRACRLRERLRSGGVSPAEFRVEAASVEVLHTLSALLGQAEDVEPEVLLADSRVAFEFISALDWPQGKFGGRDDLLAQFAFLCWRHARRTGDPSEEWHWLAIHSSTESSDQQRIVASVLALPVEERAAKAGESRLEDPVFLLCLCEELRSRLETSPAAVRDDAEFFYGFLQNPARKIGLFDECEYYLGELALTAGTACRVLFRRDEARRWFDRAGASFARSTNGLGHTARLGYQRLALALEERRLDEVLEKAPLWRESFESMEMPEDALKCRFLEGTALREKGHFAESVELFRDICRQAEEQRNIRLIAAASNNLAQYCRLLGNLEEAMLYARKALPLYKQLENTVGLVKLRWSVGNILREQQNLSEAIESYREALESAREVGMRGDVAAIHLVLADALLDAGQDRQAEWEVRAALPIIEEEKMVPEGYAAFSLLRESLRRRQIDRHALRDLHGYFHEN